MHDNRKGGALTESTLLILLSVFSPNHGYGIMQFIEKETQGRVVLGAGTLYGAINTLLEKGWIRPYGGFDGRKKEYLITDAGKDVVNGELLRLEQLYQSANRIVKGEYSHA